MSYNLDSNYEPIKETIFSITSDNKFVLHSSKNFKDSFTLKQHYVGEILNVYDRLDDILCNWLNYNQIPSQLDPGLYVFEHNSKTLKKL